MPALSTRPSARPPATAPRSEPMSPTTTATNAMNTARKPMCAVAPSFTRIRQAGAAAIAEPSAKATIEARSVSMPTMRAISGLSLIASTALPKRVRVRYRPKAPAMSASAATWASCAPVTTSGPHSNTPLGGAGITLVSVPNATPIAFSSTMKRPSEAIRMTSAGLSLRSNGR